MLFLVVAYSFYFILTKVAVQSSIEQATSSVFFFFLCRLAILDNMEESLTEVLEE